MSSDLPSSVPNSPNDSRALKSKKKEKVPRKIHKAEREKLKREQLNELFIELGEALCKYKFNNTSEQSTTPSTPSDLEHPNNGKALVVCEAIKTVNDLSSQIDSLMSDNDSLLSEATYLDVEKNELKEENSTLAAQIEELRRAMYSKMGNHNLDLNQPLVNELHLQNPTINTHPPVYPFASSVVSKPHARYPDTDDAWPSRLLGYHIRDAN